MTFVVCAGNERKREVKRKEEIKKCAKYFEIPLTTNCLVETMTPYKFLSQLFPTSAFSETRERERVEDK
jgi:hypothetical protein